MIVCKFVSRLFRYDKHLTLIFWTRLLTTLTHLYNLVGLLMIQVLLLLAGAASSPFAAVKRASPNTAAAGRPSSSNLSGAARRPTSNSPAAAGRRPSPPSPATPVGSSSSHARPQGAVKLPRHCECCYRTGNVQNCFSFMFTSGGKLNQTFMAAIQACSVNCADALQL